MTDHYDFQRSLMIHHIAELFWQDLTISWIWMSPRPFICSLNMLDFFLDKYLLHRVGLQRKKKKEKDKRFVTGHWLTLNYLFQCAGPAWWIQLHFHQFDQRTDRKEYSFWWKWSCLLSTRLNYSWLLKSTAKKHLN